MTDARPGQHRAALLALLLPLVLLLTACRSFDSSAGHSCGDSPDAVCAEDGDEAIAEAPSVPADDQPSFDCDSTAEADFPSVVDAMLEPLGNGVYTVSATLCSAYDTPERYADAWRVMTVDGDVLGIRELLHDHAGEQPFTRSLAEPVEIPAGSAQLIIQGRDLANGWGGTTYTVTVPNA